MTEKLYGNFEDVGEELIGVLSAPDIIYEANYNLLFNRPHINGVELEGDKSWDDLGLDLSPYATLEWVEDNYYTKTQTTEQIANEIDTYDDIVKSYLLGYYTKDEADGKFALAEDIPTDFYTKAETDEKIGAVEMTAVQALNTGSYANQRIDGLGDIYYTKAAAESFNRSISASIVDLYDKIPTQLSQLTPDATHRTVTDEQIAEWDAKSEFDGDYNSLSNKPTIPTRVADLSDASEYAKKAEIPTDYATQDDIDTALNVPMTDVTTVEGVGYDVAVSGNSAKLGMVGGRTVKQAVMKSVDLGTLTWSYRGTDTGGTGTFSTSDLRDYAFKSDVNAFCDNYEFKVVGGVKGASDNGDKTCGLFYATASSQANDRFLYVRDDNYHDAASFKSAMSGVMLTYESTEDELVSAKVAKIVGKSKWASVDLGTLTWNGPIQWGKSGYAFYCHPTPFATSRGMEAVCAKYEQTGQDDAWNSDKNKHFFIQDDSILRIVDRDFSDTASFKKAMQGIILYYEPTDTEYADTLDTYPIPTAIQQLDGYGLSVSDEIYNYVDFEQKKFVKKVTSVDLGTLEWYKDRTNYFYAPQFIKNNGGKIPTDNTSTDVKVLCSNYGYSSEARVYRGYDDKCVCITQGGSLGVTDTSYSDSASFKSAMSGVQLIYELTTPEEIDISQYIPDDVFIKADGSVIYHSDSGLAVPYRMQTGIMSKLWETALDKGSSAPAPSSGGMELLFEGVTSQSSPADLSNIEDYHAVMISIGKPPISNTITYFGSNVYLVSDLLMFSLTNPKRFNTYVRGSGVDCVITQDKKVYSESSVYNYLVVYGIK